MASHRPTHGTHGEGADVGLFDEEFRSEWERLSLARAVAARLIAYRALHGISQDELATRLGLRQSGVARLEAAGHVTSYETLAKVASLLGIEFTISITPADRPPRQLTRAAHERIVGSYETCGATVRLGAG
jgi:ribosome-binding protein aMBF1 (putative translation factor)